MTTQELIYWWECVLYNETNLQERERIKLLIINIEYNQI